MPLAVTRFLDLRALAQFANMRFATQQRIEGAYSGRHLSRVPGGAGEVSDFRDYCEGEDPRHVDWRVLARTGRAYIRLYQDETNLRSMLVLDCSQSMQFASHGSMKNKLTKLEYVQFLATALAYLIVRQQDQVGAALLTDKLDEWIPPGGTNEHATRVFETISKIHSAASTRLAPGLDMLFQKVSRTGVMVIMSDFLVDDLDDVFAAIRLFRHRRWDVVVLHVVHPDEEKLPVGVAYRFEGLEGDGAVDCCPAEVGAEYERRFASHMDMVRSMTLAAGCSYHRVSTAIPYLQTLSRFLVARFG